MVCRLMSISAELVFSKSSQKKGSRGSLKPTSNYARWNVTTSFLPLRALRSTGSSTTLILELSKLIPILSTHVGMASIFTRSRPKWVLAVRGLLEALRTGLLILFSISSSPETLSSSTISWAPELEECSLLLAAYLLKKKKKKKKSYTLENGAYSMSPGGNT